MVITTKTDFKRYILKMLGAPIVNVELDSDDEGQMDIIIDDTVQLFFDNNYSEANYLQASSILLKKGVSEYRLSGYGIEAAYDIDISSGLDGINVLFSPMNNMFFNNWVVQGNFPGGSGNAGAAGYGGNVGLYMAEWEISNTYMKQMKYSFDKGYRAKWHKFEEVLEIIPTPRSDGIATFRFYKRESTEAAYNNMEVKKLATAASMRLWGEIMGKYQAQFPDNMTLNADYYKTKGDEDWKFWFERLIKLNPAPDVFIG